MKNYSPAEINAHYAQRHQLRAGIYGERPYANYGYWTRPDMTIDEACDALTDLMARELQINSNDRVLECGCGYGASASYVATQFRPRSIVGLDVTEIRVQEGNRLMQELGLAATVKLRVGDATHLDFPDGSFSKAMAIECAFHFNTRADFLRECCRVLEPGGMLAMTDIVPSPEIRIEDYTPQQIREFLSADAKHICDANIYSVDRYKEILRECGFATAHVYSIKDKVVLQFAAHLERVAETSPPDARARRLAVAATFRNQLMVGGDYVVVRAAKA